MTTETIIALFGGGALGLSIGVFIGYRLGKRACRRCAKMLASMTRQANGIAADLWASQRAADAFEGERDLLREQVGELSKQLTAEQMNSKRLLAMTRPPEPVTPLK